MRIFDTHAHYLSERFDEDRNELLKELFASGITGIIECSACTADMERAIALSHEYEGVYAAVGVHPHSAGEYCDKTEELIRRLSKDKKTVAIGEIGLDYHYDFFPRNMQQEVLAAQLALAQKLSLPAILHSRESTEDMLSVLRECGVHRGVMHCFSGSAETMRLLLDMGLYIGVGGSLTFKNAVKGVEAARLLPLDRLLLETDSPYLAPVPHRGERNDSRLIACVAERLAEIKGVSSERITEIAEENARRLFLAE